MTQLVGAHAERAARAFALGNMALEAGRVRLAVKLLDRAFHLDPSLPTLMGIVMAALAAQDWQKATGYARWATQEDPKNAELRFQLGAAHFGAGHWDKAGAAFRNTLKLKPDHIGAHQQLTMLAGFLGRSDLETYHADRALAITPKSPIDRYWQSTLKLWRGDYEGGWRDYELRHGLPLVINGWRAPKGLSEAKRWTGGRVGSLLAYASQGMGDAIMMARYLPMLAERCERLTVMVHGSLVKLFEWQASGCWHVMALDDETPQHEAYVDLMSGPFHFGTRLDTVPPPAEFHVAHDAEWYGAGVGRVALCTQGGKVASLDLDRSDHTGSLASLMQDTMVFTATSAPRMTSRFEWVDFTGRKGDWLDTAQALAACDLLISVDSALAHLAGSLGVETWLVPPTHLEWRWLAGRDDSVWYPQTHKLFRRKRTSDWPGVTARIKDQLNQRYPRTGWTPIGGGWWQEHTP